MSRALAREEAMKLIYQMDVNDITGEELLSNFEEQQIDNVTDENKEYIYECVKGIYSKKEVIDKYIEKYSKGWKINRIAKVDLAIMRLAIYEMTSIETVPSAVAINEAIEIAKKFSGENSSSFINGILGSIVRELDKDN